MSGKPVRLVDLPRWLQRWRVYAGGDRQWRYAMRRAARRRAQARFKAHERADESGKVVVLRGPVGFGYTALPGRGSGAEEKCP